MNQLLKFYLLAFFILLAISCAQTGRLTGGEADTDAPKYDPSTSSKSYQTNFKKQKIEYHFDEWVKLNDVFNEVVISPPLEFPPEIKLKGKSLIFEFDEKEALRPDATYTINFGKSVQDITAGNAVEDLRFVFSTGDVIDSLQISGRVIDAFNGDPVEDVLVMMYDNLSDTIVQKEKPFYFSRTDKQGGFSIKNVKEGEFKLFALIDQNFNYLYDLPNESIGYPEGFVTINDSTNLNIVIRLFEPKMELKSPDVIDKKYGLVKLVFNQDPKQIELEVEDLGVSTINEIEGDTIRLWYQVAQDTSWKIFLAGPDEFRDTIQVKKWSKEKMIEGGKLRPSPVFSGLPINNNPAKPIRINFNHPLESFDKSRIQLLEDSVLLEVVPEVEISEDEPTVLFLKYKFKEELNYELNLFPDALTDIYGISNKDTLSQTYKIIPSKNFGNIILKIQARNPEVNHVVELFFGKNKIQTDSFKDSLFQITYPALPPGEYSLQLIEDLDDNGAWSPGDYSKQLQAEDLFFKKLDKLRANWDLDVEWNPQR